MSTEVLSEVKLRKPAKEKVLSGLESGAEGEQEDFEGCSSHTVYIDNVYIPQTILHNRLASSLTTIGGNVQYVTDEKIMYVELEDRMGQEVCIETTQSTEPAVSDESSRATTGTGSSSDPQRESENVILMDDVSTLLKNVKSRFVTETPFSRDINLTPYLPHSADISTPSSHQAPIFSNSSQIMVGSQSTFSKSDRRVMDMNSRKLGQLSESGFQTDKSDEVALAGDDTFHSNCGLLSLSQCVDNHASSAESWKGSFSCGICHTLDIEHQSVTKHMEESHRSKDEPGVCQICNLVFPGMKSFLVHLKARHESSDIGCQICGKKFQCQRYLRTHLLRHAGVKKFECHVCGWRFFERHKLKLHLELHKEEKDRQLPYRCELCGKQFINKASWSDHRNTHSGHRPFECDICDAKFAHRVGLRRHKLTHEKVKPFSCSICSRTFVVKPKLDEHMTTHTGISRHTCPRCSKVFTAASSLKRHLNKCSSNPTAAGQQAEDITVNNSSSHSSSSISEGLSNVQTQNNALKLVFMCESCGLCFSTYTEAEQHVLSHVETVAGSDFSEVSTATTITNLASGPSVFFSTDCSSTTVPMSNYSHSAPPDPVEAEHVLLSNSEKSHSNQVLNAHGRPTRSALGYQVIQTTTKEAESHEPGGNYLTGVRDAGISEVIVRVQELEQIHSAANTLADLCTMSSQ